MFLLSVTTTPPHALMQLLRLLKTSSPTPRVFGLYHCLMLLLGAVLVYVLWKYFRDASDHTMRTIVCVFWVVLIVLEIMKEVITSYRISGDTVVWKYPWSIFPFQLCSTPFYVLPFVAFLKDGFVRRAFMAYSSTYALFGGLIVLFTPGSVFSGSLLINMQTMVHHILQMAVGVYIAIHERYDMGRRHLVGGFGIFAGLLSIAVILNEKMHAYFVANGISQHFNMFFVSPYYPGPIGFINEWHAEMHPMLFVALYALGFTIVSILLCRILQAAALTYDKTERRALPWRR